MSPGIKVSVNGKTAFMIDKRGVGPTKVLQNFDFFLIFLNYFNDFKYIF
jgi:hypothetical protein